MHSLIVGISGAGKTHLAKYFAKQALAAGRGVLLYDPLGNPFPCTWRTANPDRFLDMVKASKDCLVVVDEAPTICTNLGEHQKFEWLATQSRHNTVVTDPATKHLFGHRCLFLAQKVTRIAPVYRENCTRLFAFNIKQASARILAEDFGDELLRAPTLPRYHFMFATNWNNQERGAGGALIAPRKATIHKL